MTSHLDQIKSSGLCLFVTAYFSLFLVSLVILFSPVFRHRGDLPDRSPASSGPLHDEFSWEKTLLVNRSRPGSGWPQMGGARWPSGGLVNCSTLHELTDLEFVASGWTKAVYRALFRGQPVAVKTVNLNGHDFQECQRRNPDATLAACYRRAAAKIIRELVLLTELAHSNVVKVLGSCVPDAVGPVAIVIELGEPLDTVQLLQMSWEGRLQLALGIAMILHHLARSPLGSLAMNDLRRQQFVLVNGTLKLSDVDDMGLNEPSCTTHIDCYSQNMYNYTGTECVRGVCRGHNEQMNTLKAGQHFVQHFLPASTPPTLKPMVHRLLQTYSKAHLSNTQTILAATHALINSYTHFSAKKGSYTEYIDRDLPGLFDYPCEHSESSTSCIHIVIDQSDAISLCDNDSQCKAIAIGPHTKYTGQKVAVLKKGFSRPLRNPGSRLLLKPR